jgi:hypothetical protein
MRSRKKAKLPPFVALSRAMLKNPEWRKLSPAAMIVYVYLKNKYVGTNNGEIELHYSEIRDIFAPATISKALKQLKASGWIDGTKIGGLYRYSNHYRLTGKHDTALVNYNF